MLREYSYQQFQRHSHNFSKMNSYCMTLNRKPFIIFTQSEVVLHSLEEGNSFSHRRVLSCSSARCANFLLVCCFSKQWNERCIVRKQKWWMEGKQETGVQKQNSISPLGRRPATAWPDTSSPSIKAEWKSTSNTHQFVCCDQTVFSLQFFYSSRSPLIDYQNGVF